MKSNTLTRLIETQQHFSEGPGSPFPKGKLLILRATTASRKVVMLRGKTSPMTARWFQ